MIKLKDTHRESAPQNKTQKLKQNMNVDIWVVSTLNQLFIRDSYTEIKCSKKNKVVIDETPFFVIGPFCTSHSVCPNIGSLQGGFVRKHCVFSRSTFN